jgi:hypothetical protein
MNDTNSMEQMEFIDVSTSSKYFGRLRPSSGASGLD